MIATTIPATLVIVTRDGDDVSPLLATDMDAVAWLHRHVSYSVDHATRYEGYGFRQVDAEPWAPAERRQHAVSARNAMRHNHGEGTSAPYGAWRDADEEALVRSSCGTCALHGYGEGFTENGDGTRGPWEPNHCAWERIYVESGTPIPARYRVALTEELNAGTPYAAALARSVVTFGVRYTD